MFVKRRINPEKLRAARIAAGYYTITSFMDFLLEKSEREKEPVLLSRPTYGKWERTVGKRADEPVTIFDWNTFEEICDLLNTTAYGITDPVKVQE